MVDPAEWALYASLNEALAALRRNGPGDQELAASIARGLEARVDKDGLPRRPDVSAIARLKKDLAAR